LPPDGDEDDIEDGGIRREPELPEHEDIAAPQRPINEFEFEELPVEDDAAQGRLQSDRMRAAARQAALDPRDGIEL
jgi:type IV secretion system protein VirD4